MGKYTQSPLWLVENKTTLQHTSNEQVKIRCYNYREHPDDIIAELKGILILGKVLNIWFYYSAGMTI